MTSRSTTVGFRLRKHRSLMGYSLRHAAKKAGIAPIRLSHWERDIRKPSMDNLVKLAVLYRVLVDELVFDLRQEAVRTLDDSSPNTSGERGKNIKEKPR